MRTSSKDVQNKSIRLPAVITMPIDNECIAVRFEQVGDRNRFRLILQRFRFDFPLAQCQTIENLAWWVISKSQHTELVDFCKKNGMQLREETH